MKSGKQKRRFRAQLALIYALMVLSVVSIVAILVLIVQGYRFNWYDRKVEQGGLLQFDSRPTGATVTLDRARLANRTASKITATAGRHTVTMERDGYHPWQKEIVVKPGSVLWLDYVRLFPATPQVTKPLILPAVTSQLVDPEKRTIAVIQALADPNLTLVDIDAETPKLTNVPISGELVAVPTDLASQRFSLVQWDRNGRHLILRHEFDGKTEYLVVDATRGAVIRNLTTALGVEIKQVAFLPADNANFAILTTANELRRADMNAATLSGPIASNIAEFTMTAQSTILYTTLPDANAIQSVGYVSNGSSKPKLLLSFDHVENGAVHADTSSYFGKQYTVVSHGASADVYVGNLPSSESATLPDLEKLATLELGEGVHYVGFSPNLHRMVYAQSASKIIVYDLELDKVASLEGTLSSSRRVDWLDGFHISSTAGGSLTYRDYDGTNSVQVADVAIDAAPVLSRNEKYIYHFSDSDGAIALVRTQLMD